MKTTLLNVLFIPFLLFSQTNTITIHNDKPGHTISKHIYGQFSEHLGRGIYEGLWVGDNSKIPNTRGIRNDVVKALKNIHVPNLRWPGGCFADEYHWRDGIGDPKERPKMINTHWGGVVEDNSFGTHQFLDLCEQLGAEAYITGNVGSGTVEEMADWVEYLTFDGTSPLADLRRKNGRKKPWKIAYWGVGNESWGCGGNMHPEYYAHLYNRFATYCRNFSGNELYRVAGGAYEDYYEWTETIMKMVKHNLMDGISMHYYTINKDWNNKVSAIDFDESGYLEVLKKASRIDEYLKGHEAIMDRYDPQMNIDLIIDEWGTWHAEEPGTKSGFLYQQNTLRDAFVAALTLNIFHNHPRVHMANIAQTINVLQAMILTDKEKMILTPTYHVFDIYKDFQDAIQLPLDLSSEPYRVGENKIDALSASAAKSKDGRIVLSLVNVHATKNIAVTCKMPEINKSKITGRILTAAALNAHNTFDKPENVKTKTFIDFSARAGELSVQMPAKSIIILTMEEKK